MLHFEKKDSNQILRKFRGFVCPATNDFLQKKMDTIIQKNLIWHIQLLVCQF